MSNKASRPLYLFQTVLAEQALIKKHGERSPIDYISQIDGGEYIGSNCPHYVHDHGYKTISEHIIAFLSERSIF